MLFPCVTLEVVGDSGDGYAKAQNRHNAANALYQGVERPGVRLGIFVILMPEDAWFLTAFLTAPYHVL
jgi:hypothetical protein